MTLTTSTSRHGRGSVKLAATVKARESHDESWSEQTRLISVSRTGAGFYLARKCEVGRLVSLIAPMPKELRCYDEDRELYRVCGIVQHCSPVYGSGRTEFHVGVAFIGRSFPASFQLNPCQSYRIAGMNEDGLWKVQEAERDFVVRRHQRYQVPLQIELSALDAHKNMITDERAVTENISSSGAAVLTYLQLNCGDSVNVESECHDFGTIAVVRNRSEHELGRVRLHLEFVGETFPVERLRLSYETQPAAD